VSSEYTVRYLFSCTFACAEDGFDAAKSGQGLRSTYDITVFHDDAVKLLKDPTGELSNDRDAVIQRINSRKGLKITAKVSKITDPQRVHLQIIDFLDLE
jgi:hypothetical protein